MEGRANEEICRIYLFMGIVLPWHFEQFAIGIAIFCGAYKPTKIFMKKLFLSLIAVLLTAAAAHAINVSGIIASNTTWTLANSPYVVTSTVTVNAGVTLTIDSGVAVQFNAAQGLTVNGTLNANRVSFDASSVTVARGQFGTILLSGAATITNCSFNRGTLLDLNGTAAKNFTSVNLTRFTNGINIRGGATVNFTGGLINDCSTGITLSASSRINLSGTTVSTIDASAMLSTTSGTNTFSLDNVTVSGVGTPINCTQPTSIITSGINSFSSMTTNPWVIVGYSSFTDSLVWGTLPIPYHISNMSAQGPLTIGASSIKLASGTSFNAFSRVIASGTTFEPQSTTNSRGQYGSIDFNGITTLTNCTFNRGTNLDFSGTGAKSATNCVVNKFTNGLNLDGNATLNWSGGNITDCARGVYVATARVNLSATTISTIDNEAIQTTGSEPVVSLSGVTISNVGTPVRMSTVASLLTSGTNQFLQLNTRKFIWVESGSFNYEAYWGYAPIPYHLTSGMTVSSLGRLQIASNNIIKSASAIYVDGKFIAQALPGESIYFTSVRDDNWGGDSNGDANNTSPARNDWQGIDFRSTSVDSASLLKRCQIRFANYAIETNSSSPTIDSCILSINTRCASFEGESSPTFTNNSLASSQQVPIALDFNADPIMAANSFSFSDNQFDAIGLIGSQITRNSLIKVRALGAITNITYVMLSTDITVQAGRTLTIAPGVVIKHAQSSFYYNLFRVDGTLIMNGKADSLITITSVKDDAVGNPFDTNKDGNGSTPARNDLGPIFITQTGGGTSMRFVNLKYMGGGYYTTYYGFNNENIRRDAAIVIYNASPSIRRITIENAEFGIFAYRSSNPVIDSVSFVNLSRAPVSFSMSANPTLTNISFTNVGWRALGLLGRNVSANGTVARRNVAGFTNITYVVFEEININQGTHVDIQDGVIIKFADGSSRLLVEGSLRTLGTSTNKVIFTSMKSDNVGNPGDTNGDGSASSPNRGDWDRIEFLDPSNDTTSRLSHLEIQFPQRGVVMRNTNTILRNVLINQASSHGIMTFEASRPNIDSTTIQNCNGDPVALSYASDPVFGPNVVFSQNISSGLFLHETQLNSAAQLRSKNVAGINNIAYIIENVDINSGGRLTIDPAVVIKMRRMFWYSNSWILVDQGGLSANGTASQPIYITSWKDDSVGGDTNNDGNGSVPANTDFNYIHFKNVTDSSRAYFKNSLIKYGGYSAQAMLIFENSAGYIDSCNLEHISARGIRISGTSNPRIRNSKFFNIPSNAPLWISMFSNPEIHINNQLQNVAFYTIELIPEVFSQNATFVFRSFAGIDSITYMLNDQVYAPTNTFGNFVVANGTTINVPAGMVFKLRSGSTVFGVDGRLNINGTAARPVIVTDVRDDQYGRPLDMNGDGSATVPPNHLTGNNNNSTLFDFEPVSNDSSTVRHVLFRYGLRLATVFNANPDFRHVRAERLNTGIHLLGNSTPKIDSCIFHDLYREPLNTSILTWPSSVSGNTLWGTTYRCVAIPGETLVQDITLAKRSFGGMANVPYYFPSGYTVANNAVLTLSPGLVLKFANAQGMTVNKGLIAEGGFRADSNIVFTTIVDDFYGGDSNADSIPTQGELNNSYFGGILVNNEAIDSEVRFRNVIFRYGYQFSSPETYGFIRTISASPSIRNCTFDRGIAALSASAASNPVINFCDFKNLEWGVFNVNRSFNIDARNNWWGNNSGPTHAGNPGGTGAKATDSVRYSPWLVNGSNNPIMGDVSLNGTVQAFDAAMVLQANVSLITFNATQNIVGDVTGNGSITAMDASYILQFVTGIINKFPAEELFTTPVFPDVSRARFALGELKAAPQSTVVVPMWVRAADGILSADLVLEADPQLLQFQAVQGLLPGMQLTQQYDLASGRLRLSVAGLQQLRGDVQLLELVFSTGGAVGSHLLAPVKFEAAYGNETDLSAHTANGLVEIQGLATSVNQQGQTAANSLLPVYPNPVEGEAWLNFVLDKNCEVLLEVTDLQGRRLAVLASGQRDAGPYRLAWDGRDAAGNRLASGVYLLRLTAGETHSVQRVVVK